MRNVLDIAKLKPSLKSTTKQIADCSVCSTYTMRIINEFAYGESFSRVDIYVELLQRQKINWTVVIHGSCIFESFGRKTSIDKYHHFHLNFFMQNGETKYYLLEK